MCGRYALSETPIRFAEHFKLKFVVELSPSWNIAPGKPINVITAENGGNICHAYRWGLIPAWAKDASIGYKLTNARGETVAEKPSFRNAFKHHRCLIPASGFYEWSTQGKIKQPWYISQQSGEPLAFAGLWENWRAPDGQIIQTCCIITTGANALMAPIHDRMPVILDRTDWTSWLDPANRHPDGLLQFIRPYVHETLQAWPVTRELNKVGQRDDAGLADPITL